ncbi:MAG: hypothetical protein DRO09_02140 [Thermoprotei archaeon]|nr:MAG: hypothetical protein DRO09_02140 [Thermoprotei archaeon]
MNVVKDVREFHRKYKFESRGVLLSRTVSLRYDYYQRLLVLHSLLQLRLDDRLSLSETLAYVLELASELLGVNNDRARASR